jgi:hypothetical protein
MIGKNMSNAPDTLELDGGIVVPHPAAHPEVYWTVKPLSLDWFVVLNRLTKRLPDYQMGDSLIMPSGDSNFGIFLLNKARFTAEVLAKTFNCPVEVLAKSSGDISLKPYREAEQAAWVKPTVPYYSTDI